MGLIPPQSTSLGQDASAETTALDYGALRGFDIGSVTINRVQLTGLATVPAGSNPSATSLGEHCGDPVCPYPTLGLTMFPDMDTLVRSLTRLVRQTEPPAPLDMVVERLYLFYVEFDEALPLADVRAHPFQWKVPLRFRTLRDSAKTSPAWELARTIKDGLHVAGLDLPIPVGDFGHDVALYRDHEQSLSFKPIGPLWDSIPLLTTDTKLLQLFSAFLDWTRRRRNS